MLLFFPSPTLYCLGTGGDFLLFLPNDQIVLEEIDFFRFLLLSRTAGTVSVWFFPNRGRLVDESGQSRVFFFPLTDLGSSLPESCRERLFLLLVELHPEVGY